jgi:hypothetical protein
MQQLCKSLISKAAANFQAAQIPETAKASASKSAIYTARYMGLFHYWMPRLLQTLVQKVFTVIATYRPFPILTKLALPGTKAPNNHIYCFHWRCSLGNKRTQFLIQVTKHRRDKNRESVSFLVPTCTWTLGTQTSGRPLYRSTCNSALAFPI